MASYLQEGARLEGRQLMGPVCGPAPPPFLPHLWRRKRLSLRTWAVDGVCRARRACRARLHRSSCPGPSHLACEYFLGPADGGWFSTTLHPGSLQANIKLELLNAIREEQQKTVARKVGAGVSSERR